MKYNKQQQTSKKKSIRGLSPKLLQTLTKLLVNKSGSISYVFLSEKTKKVLEEGGGYNEEPIKSILYTKIGPEMLQGEKPGTWKTEEELLNLFHSIKHDLGASYFIVD